MEDVKQLHAEANAAIANAPVEPVLTPDGVPVQAASQGDVLAGYKLVCAAVVSAGASALVPAWEVTEPEVDRLAGAMGQALLLWFPDMIIPPKYMALLAVAGVSFEIISARRDEKTGGIRSGRVIEQKESSNVTPIR